MKKFLKDFKAFISRGSVLDMAVGVIIGAAFQAVVSSMTNDIIYPLISTLVGADFTSLYAVLKPSAEFKDALTAAGYSLETIHNSGLTVSEIRAFGGIVLAYGTLIQKIVDFFIIALSIFVALKAVSGIKNTYIKNQVKFLKKMKESKPNEFEKNVGFMKDNYTELKGKYPEYFKEELEAEAKAAAANAKAPEPTTNDLLKEILTTLKEK